MFTETLKSNKSFLEKDYKTALEENFLRMDELMLDKKNHATVNAFRKDGTDTREGITAGCTANVVLVVGNKIFVANAGDSRSVLCRDGKGEMNI